MACRATRGKPCGVDGTAVATLAFDVAMPPAQRKPRVAAMVEGRRFPVRLVMAGFATRSKLALVRVVLAVTGDALHGRFCVVLFSMAFRALHLFMFEAERKMGLRVIEAGLFPVCFFVAILAFVAQSPLVPVVVTVTTLAIGGGITMLDLRAVAFRTRDSAVLALQREVCQCVIELLLVERHDAGIAALVLGMA